MDEAQKLELLAGQHRSLPVSSSGKSRLGPARIGRAQNGNSQKQIMNEHYLFDMCSATI